MSTETASLELCKELYELSGWTTPGYSIGLNNGGYPAYSLGYLLRKLPKGSSVNKTLNGYTAYPPNKYTTRGIAEVYAFPEDAACTLLIQLFKAGVLSND